MKQFIKITGSTLLVLAFLFGFVVNSASAQVATSSTKTLGTIKVLSPLIGAKYDLGGILPVRWATYDYAGKYVDVILRRSNTPDSFPYNSGAQVQRVPNTGSYSMRIGNIGGAGQYYVRVLCSDDTCNIADSNQFSIGPVKNDFVCYTFNNDLSYGSTGKDVEALVSALVKDGSMVDPGDSVAGMTYDYSVTSGVVFFQGKYGIAQTGYIGPITRAKLNSLYGCINRGDSTTSSRKVTILPVDNGTRPSHPAILVDNGTKAQYQATFNFNLSISNDGDKDIYISKDASKALSLRVNGTASASLNSKLTSTAPVNNQDTANAYIIPSGQFRIFAFSGLLDNSNGTSTSDQSVTIQKINYGIAATSTDTYNPYLDSSKFTTSVVRLYTAGYDGGYNQLSFVTPKNGDVYKAGDVMNIRWDAKGGLDKENYRINLFDPNAKAGVASNIESDVTVVPSSVDGTASYKWSIPTSIKSGSYKIEIFSRRFGTAQTSGYFNIVNSLASSTSSSVTVISPNGGDVLTEGTFNTIKWSTTGFKNTDKVQIEIWDGRRTCPANDPACLRGGGIIATNISNTGSYTWNTTLPGLSTYYGKTNQAVYKIRVIASEYPPTERTTSTSDWSDRYFSIIPSTATTSSSAGISKAITSGVCVLSSPSESQIEIGRAYAITSGKLKFNNKDYSFDGYRGYGLPSNKIMPVYLYSPYDGRIFSYVYSNSPIDIGKGTTTALKVGTIITGNEGAIRNIYNVDPSCPTYADISAKATPEATVADQIINVTSPSAGDTWTLGDTKTIRWTYPKELAGKTISLYVNLSNGNKAWEIFSSKEIGVSVNPNSRGEVPWSALKFNNIQSGAYKIEVSMTDRSNFKNYMLYSKLFNVVNPVMPSAYEQIPTATPTAGAVSSSIRVISPNGGEKIPAGSVYRIKWSSNGVPNRVNIAMVNFGSNGERYGGSDIVTLNASQGYYDWTVPNSQGYWKIILSQPLNESRTNASDESDYVFAIVSPTLNTYTPTPTATYSYTPYPSETYKSTPTATYTYTPSPTYTYTPYPTYSSTPSTSASPSYTYSPSPSSSSSASPSYSPSYSPSSSPVSFIDDFRMSLGAAIIDAVRNMFGI